MKKKKRKAEISKEGEAKTEEPQEETVEVLSLKLALIESRISVLELQHQQLRAARLPLIEKLQALGVLGTGPEKSDG